MDDDGHCLRTQVSHLVKNFTSSDFLLVHRVLFFSFSLILTHFLSLFSLTNSYSLFLSLTLFLSVSLSSHSISLSLFLLSPFLSLFIFLSPYFSLSYSFIGYPLFPSHFFFIIFMLLLFSTLFFNYHNQRQDLSQQYFHLINYRISLVNGENKNCTFFFSANLLLCGYIFKKNAF